MDRDIREHLSLAERHVSEGAAHVERQRELVKQLQHDGHDTDEALRLLGHLEELLAMYIQNRDRIQTELAEAERGLTIEFKLPP
jgi:hypothetical protein